ncbi:MAG: hypothetical protein ACRDCG_02710 [Mycoplasmoidaceae bacterium]
MNIINLSIKKIKSETIEKKVVTNDILKKLEDDQIKFNTMYFNLKNKADSFQFNGIKIIFCDNPNLLIRDLLNNDDKFSLIIRNDEPIKNHNIYYIDPFSKIANFFKIKNNGLIYQYLRNKDIEMVNQELQTLILNNYSKLKDDNLEKLFDLDFKNASILNFLSCNDHYLSSDNINNFLEILKTSCYERPLVIINDYQIISIEDIINYHINDIDFLVFTTNFKNWINQIELLELILIMKDIIYEKSNNGAIEILNTKILLDYLEEFHAKSETKLSLKKWLTNKIF